MIKLILGNETMKKPDVIFCKQSNECNTNSVVQFFENDKPDRFANILIKHFSYNCEELFAKKGPERKNFAIKKLDETLYEYNKVAGKTIKCFQDNWNLIEGEIFKLLENIFEIKFRGVKKCCAFLTINPICPRYLDKFSFEVNYKSSPGYAMQTTIHELIHFVCLKSGRQSLKILTKKNLKALTQFGFLVKLQLSQ